MHCVTWTYAAPPELTEPRIRQLFDTVADRYLAVPGLIRKYFGYSPDGAQVIGIYLWDSRDSADAFYSDEWMAGVTERWGAAPARADWVVPVVAESRAGALTRT